MADPKRISKQSLLETLPPERPEDLLAGIRASVLASRTRIVVLDDDPTGTQTVHHVPVLMDWDVDTLAAELQADSRVVYILTNSRSETAADAARMYAEIGRNLRLASERTGVPVETIARGDSTLRGHFPGELEALERGLETSFDGWIIVPFFLEGGRYTVEDIHYVLENDILVPAGETEFAGDAVFGYQSSDLRQWVAEKTGGRVPAEEVVSISIGDLRRGGPERVAEILSGLRGGRCCVVNAASYRDLEVLVAGLLAAEAGGKRYLFRTAASFVQVRGGIEPIPLLTAPDLLNAEGQGGLIMAGSYVPKTTTQIATLLSTGLVQDVVLAADALIDPQRRDQEVRRAAQAAEAGLRAGRNVLVYTSRKLLTGGAEADNLSIGNRISQGLVEVLQSIRARPRYVLAKGGITSSDLATEGLHARRALVLGQILPGVPVWRLGPESTYPGLPYIVFPGNVGGPEALAQIVKMLA